MNAVTFNIAARTKVPLRVDDYYLLQREGALADYGRTELVEGEIYTMNAQYRPHARTKHFFARAIEAAVQGSEWSVLTEVTVDIPPHNAPDPDIVLTNEPGGDGPVPVSTVALIVEISDTSLEIDFGRKASLYGRANIPEYWVVDINGKKIIRHWQPMSDGYAKRDEVAFGQNVGSQTFSNLKIETAALTS